MTKGKKGTKKLFHASRSVKPGLAEFLRENQKKRASIQKRDTGRDNKAAKNLRSYREYENAKEGKSEIKTFWGEKSHLSTNHSKRSEAQGGGIWGKRKRYESGGGGT